MNDLRSFTRNALLVATLALAATPAHALRVATWNVLDFDPTNPVAQVGARGPSFRTVLAALDPDILFVQELDNIAGQDSLRADLELFEPGQWTGVYVQLGGEGGAFFWKPAKVAISNISSIPTGGPRPVMIGLVKPVGYLNKAAWFRLYSVHLKAGTPTPSTSDSTTRRVECTSLRTTLNNQVTTIVGSNFLVGGDTNFYGSWEGGYQRLTESQSSNNGQCIDPLTMPGTWNSNLTYGPNDTQCTCLTNCSSLQAGGGLDDRFDMILSSSSLRDGGGLELLTSTYTPFGNDGNHFNSDINGNGFNTAVGLDVANALHDASDHLPVILTLQLPAKLAGESQLAFGDVLVGSPFDAALHVSNAAVAPADSLRYSLVAPAGYSAPAGGFALAPGGANTHAITLTAAAPGVFDAALAVPSNDVDTTSKSVLLSGRVLAHAVSSLDSLVALTSAPLDFGDRVAADFADSSVRVFDAGWNALQARLSLSGAVLSGGDGHFSIPGGFTPALIGSPGLTLPLRFDPAGATVDTTYTATLTLTGADEPLPGAQPCVPLQVTLRAHVVPSGAGVGDAPPALRFLPPSPNPARGRTLLAYELPARAAVQLAIFDLGGRRVASLVSGAQEAGRHSLAWERRDDSGRLLPAGLYFVRFATPGLRAVARLAVLN